MPIRVFLLVLFFLTLIHAKNNSLSELCKKGIRNNPGIKSYAYKTSASHSYKDQSIDQYKPHFSISGQYGTQNYLYDYTNRNETYNGSVYNYQFTLKQPIYRAEFLQAITDARAKEKLAAYQEEDEKAKLITQIVQSAIESIRQKKVISILEKKVSLLQKAYSNINKKYAVKLASSADKYQALAMLEQSRSDLVQAKQNYEYNLYNLRLLTKYENVEPYIASLNFNIDAIQKSYKKAKRSTLQRSIQNNTRIRYEEQMTQIAKIQIGLRDTARSPQIDAVLSYGDNGGAIDTVTRRNESRAMITLNFPIYQGGYVDDRVKEAKFLYMAAQEEAENVRLNIRISMDKALQNIKGGLESVTAQRSAVKASKKYFEGAIQGYQNGVTSLTDAYLAEADYRDNQLRLVNSEADILLSLVEVYYYSGIADYKHIERLQYKYLK